MLKNLRQESAWLRRRSGAVVAIAILLTAPLVARQGELIERTVAIVGGAVITMSDVRTALALRLVDPAPADAATMTTRLIERGLVLREVARFAPPEPIGAEVEAGLAAIRTRAGSPAALAAILARGGFAENRLRTWVRDDLRIAAHLDQRFAAAGAPAEAEVVAYARAHEAEFDALGLTGPAATQLARNRLLSERRGDLVTDWLADLRRRTPVMVFDTP